jgi:heparosan-N-sulfate-glucuronate 5-epimerase
MRSIRELQYLAGNYFRYLRGRDYFHQLQGLGHYFQDDRCYYNDLTKKADWTGPCRDGVPILHSVSLQTDFVFPITVFLYGLGSLDRYFLESRPKHLDQSRRVAEWMIANVLPQGCFDNKWNIADFGNKYYSNNSAMCQGLALSFAVRVVRHALVDAPTCRQLDELLEPMKTNMLAPVEQGGAMLCTDDGPVLLECCWKNHAVILNGWVYGVFGLMDYLALRDDAEGKAFLNETLDAMTAVLPRYRLPSGWSYYDDQGRISSPFYHPLHVVMMDALHRLTGRPVFREYMESFGRADNAFNRLRYTLVKMKDKLTDRVAPSG